MDEGLNTWLHGWEEISVYLKRSIRTCQRYEKLGLPIMRDPSGRPIALRHHIDQYLINMNRENFQSRIWDHPGIETALDYEDKREQESKEFNEKLLHAQRPTRSLY